MKKLWRLFVVPLLLFSLASAAQYNPYLKKRNKNKPSVKMAREQKRGERKQKRQYKRQLKRAKKGKGRGRR